MTSRFQEAFDDVLGHALDRAILVTLLRGGREVRYEELRRAVQEDSSQMFSYAVDRLTGRALLKRRLAPHGKGYRSYLALTARGLTLARIFDSLQNRGRLPSDLPEEVRDEARRILGGGVSPDARLPAV